MKTKNNRTNLAKLAATLVLAVMTSASAWGQMTFELNGFTYDEVLERDSKGFTTVTLPVGTDLSGLITGVEVTETRFLPVR